MAHKNEVLPMEWNVNSCPDTWFPNKYSYSFSLLKKYIVHMEKRYGTY